MRVFSAFRRSWAPLLVIEAFVALPGLVTDVWLGYAGVYDRLDREPATLAEAVDQLRAAAVLAAVDVVVVGLPIAIGLAAGFWVVIRQAAGLPAALGQAFRRGFRRGFPLWGWQLLAGLATVVGLCALIVPGLYLIVVALLLAPVVVVERGPTVQRAFELAHRGFWALVGRFVLALLVVLPIGAVGYLVPPTVVDTQLDVVRAAVGYLLVLPTSAFITVAILVTYAELRGRREPLSTDRLLADVDRA